MSEKLHLYFFSPTGGTRKAAEIFCRSIGEPFGCTDLAVSRSGGVCASDLAVIAMPVFAGRIPADAAQRLQAVKGNRKKAVTLAVYGNRAYEDALLELNDIARDCSFQVVASAALIAQHSVVPELAKGRPDGMDSESIRAFAREVTRKLEAGSLTTPDVPGSFPYKKGMDNQACPVCAPECTLCGHCEQVCPVDAITVKESGVETDAGKCMLCMACAVGCPANARILPEPMRERMNTMLAPFIPVRRENEYFL